MREYWRHRALIGSMFGAVALGIVAAGSWGLSAQRNPSLARSSDFLSFSAPAGDRPATANTIIDGVSAAVLPNGRLVTPAGVEVNVQAPKPFGLALSPDGQMLATLNSGTAAVLAHLDLADWQFDASGEAHRCQRQLHGRDLLARQQPRVPLGRRERQHLDRRCRTRDDHRLGEPERSRSSARSSAGRRRHAGAIASRAPSRATWSSARTDAICTSSIRAASRYSSSTFPRSRPASMRRGTSWNPTILRRSSRGSGSAATRTASPCPRTTTRCS